MRRGRGQGEGKKGKRRGGAGPDRAVGVASRRKGGGASPPSSLRFCSAGGEATGAASLAAATPGAMSYIPGQPVTAVVVSPQSFHVGLQSPSSTAGRG